MNQSSEYIEGTDRILQEYESSFVRSLTLDLCVLKSLEGLCGLLRGRLRGAG